MGLWAVVNGKMHLIFGHSFVGLGASDPDLILRQVSGWMELFGVNALGVDYGVGYKEDLRLMDRHPGKILIFHYTGATTGAVKTRYDPNGRKYMLPRTPSLNELFREIASQNMVFPAYESWRDFAKDLLAVRREVNDRTRTERFRATGTDDFLHVANYANIAKRMFYAGEIRERQGYHEEPGEVFGVYGGSGFANF
jgi:hypothetical protein